MNEARSAGEGLERSCQGRIAGWLGSSRPAEGVELLRAWFAGTAYQKHRHATYAIDVTVYGVRVFDYGGAVRASRPGHVVVLYPDELHDGRAGTDAGFGYRIVYVEPFLLTDALRSLRGKPGPLPFLREPVSTDPRLSRAIDAAFRAPLDSLAVDGLVVDLAHALLANERGPAAEEQLHRVADQREPIAHRLRARRRAVDLGRAADPAEHRLVVRAEELEPVVDAGVDRARSDRLDGEPRGLELAHVIVERAHRQEDAIAIRQVCPHARLVVECSAIGRVLRVVADEPRGHLVNRPYGLVQDPLARACAGIADVARLHERPPAGPQHPRPRRERLRQLEIEMDRVGGGDRVHAAGAELGAECLVQELQAPVLLQPAQEPDGDALVVAELVETHAEELRRGIRDEHAHLPV